jgi:thiamine biosynthesis lipoprotein
MNRREFLRPRQLAQTAGQALGAVDELQAAVTAGPAVGGEVTLLRLARRAMATTFAILLPFETPDAEALGSAAFDLIDELESQLTFYRPTSEVSRLNRLAPYQPVPIETRLFDLLSRAAELHAQTDGAFDVTAGALIKAWGFFKGPRRVPSEAERSQALARVGMRQVVLAPGSRSVRFGRPGLEINLGAIGKGYALDRVAALLTERWNVSAALLHGGYSSVYAKGSPDGEQWGWQVSICHPGNPGQSLAHVWLRDRALGNSAATFQYLEHQGRKLGHVLDPRTGWPASGIASASVLAPSAAEADALSTAFFVEGIDLAHRYCAAHPEVGAILLPDGSDATPVVIGLTEADYVLTQ